MSENKVVDIKNIVKQADKFNEVVPHTLKNGMEMEFHPYFSRTKIKEIIAEYHEYMRSEDKDDKAFMDAMVKDEVSVILFWYFLAVKKFTHFGEQMKDCKSAKDLIPYFNALLETGILEEIVNDVFIFSEIKKINDMFANETATAVAAMEFVNQYEQDIDKARDKFKENLKK